MSAATTLTAPHLAWRAAGAGPATWPLEPATGHCATCGIALSAGVPLTQFVGETYSQPADFVGFGSHVCGACAWWHSETKQRHRAWLVAGDTLWWPILSVETAAATADPQRPAWRDVLRHVATLPPATPLAGLLTSDPKPRLWPRVRASTVGRALLYVHSTGDKSPVGEVSTLLALELPRLVACLDLMQPLLAAGWPKRVIWQGLLTDFTRASRAMVAALREEQALARVRALPEFAVALLAAGVTKEEREVHGG